MCKTRFTVHVIADGSPLGSLPFAGFERFRYQSEMAHSEGREGSKMSNSNSTQLYKGSYLKSLKGVFWSPIDGFSHKHSCFKGRMKQCEMGQSKSIERSPRWGIKPIAIDESRRTRSNGWSKSGRKKQIQREEFRVRRILSVVSPNRKWNVYRTEAFRKQHSWRELDSKHSTRFVCLILSIHLVKILQFMGRIGWFSCFVTIKEILHWQ